MIRLALLTTDNREHHRKYNVAVPYFGPAIEAVLQGLGQQAELEVHVVSCTQRPMQAPEKLADNVWFHLLEVPKIGWMRTGYQGCVRAIRRKLQILQPDIVHGQGTERECGISAAFSGFPNVLTIHGNMRAVARANRSRPGSFLWCAALLEKLTLPRTLGVLANSSYTQSVVEPFARRVWRVPNALRSSFFETPPSPIPSASKPILLNVGTIAPHKRQLVLLDLAQELWASGFVFDLHFVGDADPKTAYAAAFLRRLRALKATGSVHHSETKTLPELIALYDSAAALVHIPSEEAFGLVVAEALARNLAVFGTEIGGLTDITRGIEGAALVPLGAPERMRDILTNWFRLGCPRPTQAASEMRARYHPEINARKHMKVYQEILGTA